MCSSAQAKPADSRVVEALEYQLRIYEELRRLANPRNTERGVWINEALVIRVCAVLEEYNVFGQGKAVDQTLPGGKCVEALRLARHCYAHSRGAHDRSRCRESDDAIRDAFGLGDQISVFQDKNILSVETVLRPGVAACIEYSNALIAKERESDLLESGSG